MCHNGKENRRFRQIQAGRRVSSSRRFREWAKAVDSAQERPGPFPESQHTHLADWRRASCFWKRDGLSRKGLVHAISRQMRWPLPGLAGWQLFFARQGFPMYTGLYCRRLWRTHLESRKGDAYRPIITSHRKRAHDPKRLCEFLSPLDDEEGVPGSDVGLTVRRTGYGKIESSADAPRLSPPA